MYKKVNQTIDQLGGLWLGTYLAGLVEGTGRFGKDRLELLLVLANLPLAEALANRWNGQICRLVKKPNSQPILIIFFTGQNLAKIITSTNGYYVSNSKLDQIQKYKLDERFGIQLKPPLRKVDWDSLWLAGFFDCSGHITIRMDKVIDIQPKISGFVPSSRALIYFYNGDKQLLEYIAAAWPYKVEVWPMVADPYDADLCKTDMATLYVVYIYDNIDLDQLFGQFKLFSPFGYKRNQLEPAWQCFKLGQDKPLRTLSQYNKVKQLINQLNGAAK